MIVEIVPFSEVHWAVWEIAFQDLKISLRLWVLELEYSEHLGRRDVWVRLFLVDFELLIETNLAAEDDFDLIASGRDLVENALIFNFFSLEYDAFLAMVLEKRAIFAVALSVEAATAARGCEVF